MTIEEARGIAARAWCEPSTSHMEMDVVLAEAFAQVLLRELGEVEVATKV